ncbi:MAG: hypothetical protein CL946_12810 [Ectothiorhodospiraceae bacterium]|nr:hypothetical protein [Ectothiorhodospiraceae bacterium]
MNRNLSSRIRTIVLAIVVIIQGSFIVVSAQDPVSLYPDLRWPPHLEGQRVEELSFKNADLRDIVRMLGTRYRLNIIVDNTVQKRVTIHLVDVPVSEALQYLAKDNNLEISQTGPIFKMGPPAELPPAPKEWNIHFVEERLSVELQAEPVTEAITQIAKETGKTILVDRDINGNLTGQLINTPFEAGFRQLLSANGYRLNAEGQIYRVTRDFLQDTPQGNPGRRTGLWVQMHEGLIQMESRQASLNTVLDELSRQSGKNFLLLGQTQKLLDVRINGLTLESCLQSILLEYDFTFKENGNVILIGDKANPALTRSELFRLRYLKVDGILEMLPNRVMAKAELKVIPEHNALLASASQDVIVDIADIIRQIDRPIPQIFFEALVVDYRNFDIRELSVEAGIAQPDSNGNTLGELTRWVPGLDLIRTAPSLQHGANRLDNFITGVNIGRLPRDFYVRVRALEQAGKANIRSRPQLATLNGHPAELKIGETRYFRLVSETPLRDPSQVYLQTSERFQTVEINISLNLTPWVSASGEITVEIHPEFNTPGEQVSENVPPNIQTRSLNATVRVQDGETIILGGLIQEIENESVSRLPLLGRIPILGRLFSSQNHDRVKNELIIYLTPHLTYSEDWMQKN